MYHLVTYIYRIRIIISGDKFRSYLLWYWKRESLCLSRKSNKISIVRYVIKIRITRVDIHGIIGILNRYMKY